MTTLFVSVNHTILDLKRQAVKAPCICARLVIVKPLVYASIADPVYYHLWLQAQ